MQETPPPPLGSSKPHLEKLTLGITRILGEWGAEPWGRCGPRGRAREARGGGKTLDAVPVDVALRLPLLRRKAESRLRD